MSSLRNAVYRRAHKERAQPQSRQKFGILEKHKDYVERAKAFHKKEEVLQKLREKAAFRNPDEFYFKMINTRTVNGIHRPPIQANKYTQDELLLMKTQDIGYVLQKIQSEKKKIEKMSSALHSVDSERPTKHIYYVEDREEAKELNVNLNQKNTHERGEVPRLIRKKMAASYKQLEERKQRVKQLENLYNDMALQKELQKPGRKRKLRPEDLENATSKPVYKWRTERKR